MTKQPLISIITVVYNGEKYLQQTINSVHNQSYKNIEYIIIDGGSIDNTLNLIKKNEFKISKWVSEPDKGLYDAMNKGIKLAKGKLIGIINSDDWYEKDAVQNIVNEYLLYPHKNIFHGDVFHIAQDNTVKLKKHNPSVFLFKYYGMMYNHPSMFVSKSTYQKYQYNIHLKSLSDYQFALEVFYDDESEFHYLNKVISNFRLGGVSANINITKSLKEGYIARKNAGMNIIENYFSVLLRLSIFTIKKSFPWIKKP